MNARNGMLGAGRVWFLAIALAAAAPAAAQSAPDQGDTAAVRRVIARYVQAIGGEEAIRALRSQRMRLTVELPGGIEAESETLIEHQRRVRVRLWMAGELMTERGHDGRVGWFNSPGAGAMLLDGPLLDELRSQMDLHAPLHGSMRNQRLIGPSQFEGRPSVAVSMSVPEGDVTKHFDVESGLLAGIEQGTGDAGVKPEVVIVFSDYKQFGRVLLPTTTTMRAADAVMKHRITEVDFAPIDPAKFAVPEAVRAKLSSGTP